MIFAIELDNLFLDTAWEPRELRNKTGFTSVLVLDSVRVSSVGALGSRRRDGDGQSCEILVI